MRVRNRGILHVASKYTYHGTCMAISIIASHHPLKRWDAFE